MAYQEINSRTIDLWCQDGWQWGKPISHETYVRACQGQWDVLLTPTKPVPHHWFGDLKGKKVLGLASGGGQQMPIFAALGAECTVLDYSDAQLASEKMMAEREGYDIRIVKADMTKPLPFEDESFDLIFHPVEIFPVRQNINELLGAEKEGSKVVTDRFFIIKLDHCIKITGKGTCIFHSYPSPIPLL